MKMCSPGEQRPFTWKKNDIEKMTKLKHQHQSEILKDGKQWKVMKSNKSKNIRSHHSYMLCICDWSWLDRKQNASRSKSSLPGPDRSKIGTQVCLVQVVLSDVLLDFFAVKRCVKMLFGTVGILSNPNQWVSL